MLVPMAKVEIVGHRRHLDAVLALLQRHGAVHLLDATAVPGLRVSSLAVDEGYAREGEELRQLGLRIEGLLDLAGNLRLRSEPDTFPGTDLDELLADLDEMAPRLETAVKRIDELENEHAALPRHVESLRRLLPLIPELPRLETYETVALLIDSRHAGVVELLRDELTEMLGSRFDVLSGQIDRDTVGAVLVFPRRESRRIHAMLSREQVSRVQLPEQFRGVPLASAVVSMERRIGLLPTEIREAKAALAALLSPVERWERARAHIGRRIAQIEALRLVGTTEKTFVIVGWAPRRRLEELADSLTVEAGAETLLAELEPAPDDEPPILLTNPAPVRPFQLFVRMLALPRYGTLDPTMLMSFFVPLFFGIMLGDVAYGLVLLGVAVWAGKRWGRRTPVVADLARILGLGAAWAVVWGFVFGEILGDLGHRVAGLEPIWINREEAIEPLLVLAVAIGVTHVLLGLALGVWVSARRGDRRRLTERAALMLTLVALCVIAGAAADVLPHGAMTPAVVAVIVAFVLLVAVQWPLGAILGPLDLLGIVTNVLSYLRIAALGLASVFLARVANELGATAPLAIGIVIAALFHVLNLALGAFSPTIQALRLHYVEFFDKFYEPGGAPFQPFGGSIAPVPDTSLDRSAPRRRSIEPQPS